MAVQLASFQQRVAVVKSSCHAVQKAIGVKIRLVQKVVYPDPCKEVKKAAAPILGCDYPLLTVICPGLIVHLDGCNNKNPSGADAEWHHPWPHTSSASKCPANQLLERSEAEVCP